MSEITFEAVAERNALAETLSSTEAVGDMGEDGEEDMGVVREMETVSEGFALAEIVCSSETVGETTALLVML